MSDSLVNNHNQMVRVPGGEIVLETIELNRNWCWDVYDEKVYGSYRIFRGAAGAIRRGVSA